MVGDDEATLEHTIAMYRGLPDAEPWPGRPGAASFPA
jgi:hypothetical protein